MYLAYIKPLGNYDVPTGWPSKPYKRPYGGTPGAPVMYQKPSDPDETGAGYGYSNAEGLSENDVYFYHSDHLGSTSYITDKDGNVSQFIAYKPFGELLTDEHSVSYDSPWKFNGKEWDSETGLYYYGARYYEPRVGLWYGVDALTEKYPSVGGYVYCAANPVRFVDTDGNKIIFGSNVTDEQKSLYNTAVSDALNSPLFSTLYSKLEESSIEYTILFGTTVTSTNGIVYAQFDPVNNSILFNDNMSMIPESAITEELFHALQFESNEDCNREFEAKVFVYASVNAKSKSTRGMNEFYDYLFSNMITDAEGRVLTPSIVNSSEFIQRYKTAANSYAEYNRNKRIGNAHYWKKSDSVPELLIKIVSETYKESE